MLQIAGLILISWLSIWIFTNKNLFVLGFLPTRQRIKYFLIAFLVASLASALGFVLKIWIANESYILNRALTPGSVLTNTWHQFRMVLTEELLFRGAMLYILIQKTGPAKAILISSLLFGAMHWTNTGVWGDPEQMIIVFVFTFFMGLLLAYGYVKTGSILIPFAIHFGWNLMQNYIFPGGPSGSHVFVLYTPPPTVTVSYFAYFTMLLLPKITVLAAGYLVVKQYGKPVLRQNRQLQD